MNLYITLLLVACFSYEVFAYSGGAPVQVCDDMTPKHPAEPQKSKIPFSLKLSQSSATPGERVKITLVGNTNNEVYKGLLIQGRKGNEIIGSFDVSDTDKYIKTINCPKGKKNAVTHKNNEDKTTTTVDYIVPNVKGQIKFFVTVAKNGAVYWVKQPLATLNVK